MRIILLSDNHGYLGQDMADHLRLADEIWHAGDIGDFACIEYLQEFAPVVAVYGNVDGHEIRAEIPENQIFIRAGVKVLMTHIGGYPGRYSQRVRSLIESHRPDVYICGHSHICKVMRDQKYQLLHMNPGAYGHHGFHHMRTILSFDIENGKICNLQAVELGKRGKIEAKI